ncbi:MAG: bifunctional DNA primase/polymerase [Dehalococcoidales bacterium]|jgi:hypothetical protein
MNTIVNNAVSSKLINKIPHQLQKDCFGFVKLKPRTKIPFEQDWQNKSYTFANIQPWIDQGGNYGVLGGVGDLIIIDADTSEIRDLVKAALPNTLTVASPGKGPHYYFICKDIKKKIVLKRDETHFGEIIATGSQVVGSGSIHPSTNTEYTVSNDVEIATVSREQVYSELREYIPLDLPKGDAEDISILDVLSKANVSTRKVGSQLVCGHPVHGSTNNNNFVVHPDKNVWCCFRCNTGGGPLSLIAVLEKIIDCSEAKPGALKGDKFSETCRIAKEKYDFNIKKDCRNLPQGEVLTRICEEHIKTYFTDQQGEPFVVLPFDGHLETCSARSTRLRNWLAGLFRENNQRPPNSDALKQAQIQVEVGCSKSQQIELFNRLGWHEGAVYYDLTMPDWSGVKVTKDGWEIAALPPVFRRYKHQARQVTPIKEGSPNNLLRFCNIREDDQCLFMVTIATFFIPDFPHAIPYLDGTQGAGKSIASKNIKSLVDPSMVMLMSTPKDLEHVQMIAEKHWVNTFDNISRIPEWFSDFLCRGVTGEGDMKRSLYTNDDEFIRAYRRCFVLNGIGTYAERPDLLDRSIIFEIPELCAKRSEDDIKTEWNQMLPGILGGFFTAISKAMGVVDQVKGHEAFRMSDFARWGAALAGSLGYSQDEFFKKYQESVDRKWEEAADVNTLNGKIAELVRSSDEWKGSFSDLLEEINPKSNRDRNLPGSPRRLSSALKRIGPLLHTSGIKVSYPTTREPGTGRKHIILHRLNEQTMGVNVGVNVCECPVNVDDKIDTELF